MNINKTQTKLLIISGPTATGKTSVAINLAKKFNGELISADSRQIYRGLDIGTGKDHPKNIKIHLIDIINPNQSFSVAQYRLLALNAINDIISQGKLPIIVGGTGQYIESIIHPHETFVVKPNHFLRFFLDRLPVSILQKIYYFLDKNNYHLLNNSDINNPRRLIRRIEVKLSHKSLLSKRDLGRLNILHLSLTDSIDNIIPKIDSRVEKRLKLGLFNEIKNILKKYKWSHPGLNALAYHDFKSGFNEQNIELWKIHEHQYARRQLTWFKKFKPDYFIDISKPNFQDKINKLVSKWYNKL